MVLANALRQVRAAALELERISGIAKWLAANGGVSARAFLPINGAVIVYPNGVFVKGGV